MFEILEHLPYGHFETFKSLFRWTKPEYFVSEQLIILCIWAGLHDNSQINWMLSLKLKSRPGLVHDKNLKHVHYDNPPIYMARA